MTQEVQPLTWQKRTNLEEHQQFFSKINEIIANLAPTVNEAEAAIAQATQAIASANAAIETANAASANADAASQQAQTAATTVAGYNSRLTAAEGDIDTLQSADQTINGNIASLDTRMTAAESKNAQQDASIAALETADGQNVKINRINDYAVGLTGNQDVSGLKNMTVPIHGGYMLFNENLGTFGDGEYVRIYRGQSFAQSRLMIYGTQANNGLGIVDIMVGGSDNYDRSYMITLGGVFKQGAKFLVIQSSEYTELWMKRISAIGYIQVIVVHNLRDFVKTNVVAGTGLTEPPVIGGTNPITSETITGVKEVTLS